VLTTGSCILKSLIQRKVIYAERKREIVGNADYSIGEHHQQTEGGKQTPRYQRRGIEDVPQG
jgi:hypothetical protein